MSQITKSPFSDSKVFGFSHYNENAIEEIGGHRAPDRKDAATVNKKGEVDLRGASHLLLEGKSPLKDAGHSLFMNKLHMHQKVGDGVEFSEKGLSTTKDPIKPAESPFTLFCKELRLSPAPLHFASPSPFGFGFPFKPRPEILQFASPSPVPMRHFNEFDSPFQPRKHPARLNFEFMFQNNQEDHTIEADQQTIKQDDIGGRVNGSKSPFSPKFSQMKKSVYTLNGAPSYNVFPKNQTQTPDTKFSDHDSEKQIIQETADGGHEDRAMKVESEGYFEEERPTKSNNRHHHHDMDENHHHLAQRKSSLTSNSQGFGEDGVYHEDGHQHSGQKAQAKVCCNCKKSRCLKLYCDCFARGEYCKGDCNCVQCLNTKATEKERQQAMASITEKNPNAFKPKVDLGSEVKTDNKGRHSIGCHCKKSGCQKKYCECYQAGVECSEYCRCENCKNTSNSSCNHKKPKKNGSLGLKSDNSSKNHSGSKENHRSNNRSSDYENIYEEDEEIAAYSQPVKKLHTENGARPFDVSSTKNSKDFDIPKLVLPGGGSAMEFENDGQYMKKFGSHEKHSKRTRALHTAQHSYHK